MSTPATGVQEWRDIDWAKAESGVHTLQRRIYQASGRGDVKAVHRLQRLLMSSWSAKCLAVRRVTQDNRGKRTAGVDGVARLGPVFVLDADIAKCFDRIDQDALLAKLNTFPLLRRVIKAWLKAGVLDGDTLFPTEEGTPQGGVISPLPANVALHGLEEAIRGRFPARRRPDGKRGPSLRWAPHVVRYADDFVVLHPDLDVVTQCQAVAQEWLRGMGLELKPSKTRIAHTLDEQEGRTGFDFLGFTVRQFPVGKYHTGVLREGVPLGFKTIIRPSKAKVQLHRRRLAETVRRMRGAPQWALIKKLNPLIRGWSGYYRAVVSKATFKKVDDAPYHLLRSWAFRRHNRRNIRWVVSKYWRTPHWTFGTPEGLDLLKHADTPIVRHVKVQGGKSPYDGDWAYWASRMGCYPGVSTWLAMLLRRQQGKCARCGLYFTPRDPIEVHHRDGDRTNDQRGNLAAFHGHCHDNAHGGRAVEVVELDGGVRDKD